MDKKIIIVIAVVVLISLGGGGYYVMSSNKGGPTPTPIPQQIEEELDPISASDLGLKLVLREDNRAIKFVIENASDIESVDYQISYMKEVKGEQVPEGLIGEAKPEDGRIEIKYRELGTCSSGRCRYDTVVSPVKVTLKVLKTNGKGYQAEDSISL